MLLLIYILWLVMEIIYLVLEDIGCRYYITINFIRNQYQISELIGIYFNLYYLILDVFIRF